MPGMRGIAGRTSMCHDRRHQLLDEQWQRDVVQPPGFDFAGRPAAQGGKHTRCIVPQQVLQRRTVGASQCLGQQRRDLIARVQRPASDRVYVRRADMLGTETAPDQDRRNRL